MISAPLLRVSAAPNRAGASAVGAPFRLRATASPSSSSGSRPSNVRCAAPPQAAAAAAAVASTASSAASTPYDVLGLRAGATAREIKAAYRRLARERHPDVAPGPADDFVRLHDAYATLSDPDSRARYDRAAVAVRPRPGWGSGAARPRRRTWETDQCW